MFRKLSFFLAVVLLASCKHYYYAPNTLNIPTVREKGDLTVDLGLAGGNNINGWEGRVAYMPINHLVVTANHTRLGGSFTDFTTIFDPLTGQFTTIETRKSGHGYLTEGGIGLVKTRDYLSVSITAGGGVGRVFNDFGNLQTADLGLRRIYVQPAMMMSGELAEFGCGLRFSQVDFYQGRVTYNADNPEIAVLQRIDDKAPFFLTDFGLTAGLKFKAIHLRGHFVFSLFENNDLYNFASNNASVSMSADIHQLWKKK